MKKISLWGKNHKKAARIIIVGSFILLTAIGIATGSLFTTLSVTIPSAAMFAFICIYFVGILAYPAKSLRGKKINASAFYLRQKSCDFLLAASTFCMIVFLSNQPGHLFNYSDSLSAAVPFSTELPKDSTVKNYKTITAFSASLKNETGKSLKWKEKKQLLKNQIKAIKNDSDLSKGAKVALIILSVLVAIGLIYLVAALACSISCGGSEALAILVMVGGTGLTAFLLLLAIRAITGKKVKPKKTDSTPDNPVKTGS